MTTTPRLRALDGALTATAMQCMLTQHTNGSWVSPPSSRIPETALACFALSRVGDNDSLAAVARARSWLFHHPPVRNGLTHPVNELVEQALWSLAVDDAQPVELRHPALVGAVLKDPEELRWFRVVQALALHRDRPIRGGLSVDALRRALRNDAVDEEPAGGLSAGSDRHTESLALYVLLEFPSEQNESALAAAQRLISAQSADDDFGRNPLSTSLAFLAMDFTARGGPAWQRCRTQLLRGQRPDGTWRHPASDVRDTASTVRVFREDPAFTTHALPAAVAFLCASQNDDGGWPARRGTDSDCGTTAQVLSALAGLGVPDLVIRRALGYLERRRTPQGLWSCHVAGDSDEPYEETVAQVVSALRHYRRPDTPPTERARAWLLDERLRLGHPEPGRYRGDAYAVFRTVEALGWSEPAVASIVRRLAGLQNRDGGWAYEEGGPSASGPTGLALAALGAAGILDEESWATGTDYLVSGQRADGTWADEGQIASPHPLPLACPALTRAFTAMGLRAARGFCGERVAA